MYLYISVSLESGLETKLPTPHSDNACIQRKNNKLHHLLVSVSSMTALRCYRCFIHPQSLKSNESAQLCSHFDGSSLYETDCNYSTFCMKRTFELPLQKGSK